ncbi:uncharacterized protein [Amphiura filiformis]|uniref:uncharacterized protein n=1 Tax=Amphiura filiformis TaxID=82378 RepID=UPI003B2118AB
MYAGWRNWGLPDGWIVRNPMYNDPGGMVQGPPGFWPTRRRESSLAGFPTKQQPSQEPRPLTTIAENESEKPRIGSVRDIDNSFGYFATNVTSAHGFVHIYTASSIIGRIIWTLIVLGAIAAFIWQMEGLVARFIAFGTVTEVTITTQTQLEFPAVTVCNLNSLRRSAIAKSKHRHVLYVDDLTPLPYYIPCQEGDFLCDNEYLCVRSYLLCDGVDHCKDKSDEKNCTYGPCGAGQFKCNKGSNVGYCIRDQMKCDGTKTCYDGEDEWDCTCRTNEFKCIKQGGCIGRNSVCDGNSNCVDESDEEYCPDLANDCDGGYVCDDSFPEKCIPARFLCDGVQDCDLADDEVKGSDACNYLKPADAPEECIYGEFDCQNGECIPEQYKCDQYPDCSNRMDEMDCGRVRCDPEFEQMCGNMWQCVDEYDVCDFFQTCEPTCEGEDPTCVRGDPTDEKDCTCLAETGDETPLYAVNCAATMSLPGSVQYAENAPSDAVEIFVKCSGRNDNIPAYAHYLKFECNGQLTCADVSNEMPQTCTSVFTDCYVNTNGADYKGTVATSANNDPCVKWNAPLPVAYGIETDNPLIGKDELVKEVEYYVPSRNDRE